MLIYKLFEIHWLIRRNDYIRGGPEVMLHLLPGKKKEVPEDGVAHCTLNCGVDVGYDLLGQSQARCGVSYVYEDELREK